MTDRALPLAAPNHRARVNMRRPQSAYQKRIAMRPQPHATQAVSPIRARFPSSWLHRSLTFGGEEPLLPVITQDAIRRWAHRDEHPNDWNSFRKHNRFIRVAEQIYRDGFLPVNLVPLPRPTFDTQQPRRVHNSTRRVRGGDVIHHRFEPKRNRRARVVAIADDRRVLEEVIRRDESATASRSHAFTNKIGYTVLFTSVFVAGLIVAKRRRTPDWILSRRWALSSLGIERRPRRRR